MIRALVILALATIPPLTGDERTALETARDGGDHREAAFVALLGHVRRWLPEDGLPEDGLPKDESPEDVHPGDEPVRLRVDPDVLLADPDAFRGELYRIRGVIQQRAPLAAPYDGAEEWFVRDERGRPSVVYVAGTSGDEFRDGTLVVIWARFYKRLDAVARDGEEHTYAAFVGADPRRVRSGPVPYGAGPTVMLVLLPALIAVFVVVLIAARRRAGPRRVVAGVRAGTVDTVADGPEPPLPAAPDAALAELHRRADDSTG